MKKLQSLENFKKSGLSLQSMSKLTGGENTITEGGCISVENLDRTSTGLMSFTSDTNTGTGITYHGTVDVKTCPTN